MKQTTFLKVTKNDFDSNVPMQVYMEIENRRQKYQIVTFNGESAYEFQFEGNAESIQDIVDVWVKNKYCFEISEFEGNRAKFGKGYLKNGEYFYDSISVLEQKTNTTVLKASDLIDGAKIKKAFSILQESSKTIEDYKLFEDMIAEIL